MGKEFDVWQLERKLIVQRLQIFLLTNSILFLGYVQVRESWLGVLVAFLGLICCVLGGVHFAKLRTRFRALSEVNEIKEIENRFAIGEGSLSGRFIVILFVAVFGIIWIGSAVFSLLD